ncbi:hypothetical protein [Thalassotalea piscium]|uniref:DUF4252 domain-containing protein n=1 Tax=Thalassotalea piscium TaxID=1230533 RepID=A0A7X0TV16_9GAMM|nr:hypothetical protein [Thalassotalea piscium]MBB6544967.1 hypothetical protein [Thalassotalea piscium]
MKFKTLSLACALTFNVYAHANTEWPSSICESSDLTTSIVDLAFCFDKKKLTRIQNIGGSIPTFTYTESNGGDISVGYIPSSIVTNDLHIKYKLSVQVFFQKLYEKSDEINNINAILNAYNINVENHIFMFQNNDVKAYAIIGKQRIDTIYITTPKSEFVYQITGDISLDKATEILSRIKLPIKI